MNGTSGSHLSACVSASRRLAASRDGGLVRVTGRTFPGREHWAVFDGAAAAGVGRVTDPTAHTFDADLPPEFATDLDSWLDAASGWLADTLDVFVFDAVGDTEPAWTGTWLPVDVDPLTDVPRSPWREP